MELDSYNIHSGPKDLYSAQNIIILLISSLNGIEDILERSCVVEWVMIIELDFL